MQNREIQGATGQHRLTHRLTTSGQLNMFERISDIGLQLVVNTGVANHLPTTNQSVFLKSSLFTLGTLYNHSTCNHAKCDVAIDPLRIPLGECTVHVMADSEYKTDRNVANALCYGSTACPRLICEQQTHACSRRKDCIAPASHCLYFALMGSARSGFCLATLGGDQWSVLID